MKKTKIFRYPIRPTRLLFRPIIRRSRASRIAPSCRLLRAFTSLANNQQLTRDRVQSTRTAIEALGTSKLDTEMTALMHQLQNKARALNNELEGQEAELREAFHGLTQYNVLRVKNAKDLNSVKILRDQWGSAPAPSVQIDLRGLTKDEEGKLKELKRQMWL